MFKNIFGILNFKLAFNRFVLYLIGFIIFFKYAKQLFATISFEIAVCRTSMKKKK